MKNIIASVKNLTAAFGDNVVLDEVSLDIYEGEIIAIIGGSGSGKTTLLKHFIGLLKPVSGIVELFGQDWGKLDEENRLDLRRNVGVLFQNGALLGSKSLLVNIAIPMELHTSLSEPAIRRVVLSKLRSVGLEKAAEKMPSELSGGMRKRAALARALALDPSLLFCDEPAAGLDPITLKSLDDLLLEIRVLLGLTIVVVTHEIAQIKRIADRIAYLESGKLIFVGPPSEALHCGIESVEQFFHIAEVKEQEKV